ncbi:MAG: hypothetical protein F6J98_08420 [Moorea sp. SIO4G2]|nr:hypothetical protein [Moorena sp. SIO4G2]
MMIFSDAASEQGSQCGLGEAARSWGFPPLAIAVVSPMSNWRGFPHSRFASRQRQAMQRGLGGFPHSLLHQDN